MAEALSFISSLELAVAGYTDSSNSVRIILIDPMHRFGSSSIIS